MSDVPAYVYDADELKFGQLDLTYVAERLGHPFDEDGRALCPFHDDRNNPNLELMPPGDDGVPWFYCRACGVAGDVLELVRRKHNVGFTQALVLATELYEEQPRDWEPTVRPRDRIDWTVTAEWEGRLREHQDRARQHVDNGLLSYAYGLTRETDPTEQRAAWDRFLIEEWGWGLDEAANVVIPHRTAAGLLTAVKVKFRNGAWKCYGQLPELYGSWRARTSEALILCEGESDTVWASSHACGTFDALGLPAGAGALRQQWVEHVRSYPLVCLALDNDEGSEAARRAWRQALDGTKFVEAAIPEGRDLRGSDVAFDDMVRWPT